MPMIIGLVLSGVLWTGSNLEGGRPSEGRIQVAVSLAGDDGLTQNLQSTLERHVETSRDLELTPLSGHGFQITTDTNVQSDVLGGRRVVIYRAILLRGDETLVDRMGVCFERNMDKCARDILHSFRPVMEAHAAH